MNLQYPSRDYNLRPHMCMAANVPTNFRPNLNVHGSHPCFNLFHSISQVPIQPQHLLNTYSNHHRPPPPLIFQPNNLPINVSNFSPFNSVQQEIQMPNKFLFEVPIMPRDPEMLKNIDLLSSFVVKNGLNFEQMTKEKQANNPKFGFLFESEPDTEATIGRIYYEWKKNALQATFHPLHEFQAPPYVSINCSHLMIEDTQKEMCNHLNQGSILSEEINMDIEDEKEGLISTHSTKEEHIEEIKDKSIVINDSTLNSSSTLKCEKNKQLYATEQGTISNNINEGNYETPLSTPHEVLILNEPPTTISYIEDNFCTKRIIPIKMGEEIESNTYNKIIQSFEGNHQICNGSKDDDTLDVTPICCSKTLYQSVFIESESASIDVPQKQSIEMEYTKALESFQKTYEIGGEIEAKTTIMFEQDDGFGKDTIEKMDLIKEENLSNVNEEESNYTLMPKELCEIVSNQTLLLETTNLNLQIPFDTKKEIESIDSQLNANYKESNCSLRPKESCEVVSIQPLKVETTNTNLQTSTNTIKASMKLNHQSSSPLVDSKSMPKILDEFGRIMKHEVSDSDSDSNNENIHCIYGNKTTSIQNLKRSRFPSIRYNCRSKSPSLNPSPRLYSKRKQRYSPKYQQNQDMSSPKNIHCKNNIMKGYSWALQNANYHRGVKRRSLNKCFYYAQGRCHRGNHCWYKHFDNDTYKKYDNKEVYQNGDHFKDYNWEDANKKQNIDYSGCNLRFGEGVKTSGLKNEHNISFEKNIDYSKAQSKSLDNYECKKSKIYLEHRFVNKAYEKNSIKYSIKYEKEVDQISGKNEQKIWQEGIKESTSSYNGCNCTCGEDAQTLQAKANEDISHQNNINNSKKLSNVGDYKKTETPLKNDELIIKSLMNKEEKKYELSDKKSQLTDTTMSSENLSALSSTASLDHIQEISSIISPQTQISTQFQERQTPNLTKSIVNNQTKVLSIDSLKDVCGNISNSTSLDVFIPTQPSIQATTLPPPSNHQNIFYPTSMLNKTPNITPSKTYNILPSTQYQQFYMPISENQGIHHNNIMEPSSFFSTTSIMQPTNQCLLSSLTNSQQSSQNVKYVSSSLLQNDNNMTLRHPPQPLNFNYPFHHTLISNESPQQHYFNTLLPQQLIHSSQIQNDCQSKFKRPSSINEIQYKDERIIPPPLPTIKWSSPLISTTMINTLKPTQVTIQQNYIVPPPPPPPPPPLPSLKQFHSKEFNNIFQSYSVPQIYDSLQKHSIDSKPLTNYSYEVTNLCSKVDTILPSQGLELFKDNLSQPHNLGTPILENISPAGEGSKSWRVIVDENTEDVAITKHEQKKKIKKEDQLKVRGLTLLRTKVAEYIREILKPKWREGIMTKEAFKTITKKAVDKVIGTIKPHHVPNTVEKIASYMMAARPKILKLVQGYVDKYVRE